MTFLDYGSLKERLEKGKQIVDNKNNKELLESNPKQFFNEVLKNLPPSQSDSIIIHPYDEDKLGPNSYELSLGNQVYTTTDELPTDFKLRVTPGYIRIEPGEFAILTTDEYVYVPPDLVGFISIRYRFKERGLVNVSGFHVDPGFFGKLLFTVFNAGPSDIVLKYKENVFLIMFAELKKKTSKPYAGEHQVQRDVPSDAVARLHGTSISPRNLDERLKKVELWLYILTAFLVPISISFLIGLVRLLTGG